MAQVWQGSLEFGDDATPSQEAWKGQNSENLAANLQGKRLAAATRSSGMRRSKEHILATRRWLHAKHRYAGVPTSVSRLQEFSGVASTCCCIRFETVALLHAFLRSFYALAAGFVVRGNRESYQLLKDATWPGDEVLKSWYIDAYVELEVIIL
jgi:hypothetical protein